MIYRANMHAASSPLITVHDSSLALRSNTCVSHFRKFNLTHLFNVEKHWSKPNKVVQSFLCMSDNTACNTISVSAAGVAEDARHLS